MTKLGNSHGVFFMLLMAVVVSSGCIETDSTDLGSDFNLDYDRVELNSTGQSVYQDSLSRGENVSEYEVESDNRMAMKFPGVSISVNMTSEGVFDDVSEVNTSGFMGFNFIGNSNSTEFNTMVRSTDNGSETFQRIMGKENRSEGESYGREELGITLEALNEVEVEGASVLGVSNQSGEENILLELEVNNSDLMRNSEQIFEVHSVVRESTDSGEGMESAGSFNETKAYLWTNREDRTPSKFAYYGSVDNGTIQVRSVTEYR